MATTVKPVAPADARELSFGMHFELTAWATLAVSSLAIAGLFAILLAFSRLPGVENVFPWPLGFFGMGLVIHVVFSFVVWFLAVFALMVAVATAALPQPRLVILGRVGVALTGLSFPLLFGSAFAGGGEVSLNNYVPVIAYPAYYVGLGFLALGILLPVARLYANLIGRSKNLSALEVAMAAGGVAYLVALICVGIALSLAWSTRTSPAFNERLFWGAGHALEYTYCALMLTAWFILTRASLGKDSIDADIFRLAVVLVAVFVLPGPYFYRLFEAFSAIQRDAFTRLQLPLVLPTVMIAVGAFVALLRQRRVGGLPWRDPAFLTLVLSIAVFGVGGAMGLMLGASDTRIPAHYHAVIAAVTVASMGLMLTYCLPLIKRPVVQGLAVRLQLGLFGIGQLVASVGLFLAGGYGAPRKTPGAAAHLVDGAIVGMYLNGIGALFAVIGGAMFVVIVLRALAGVPKSRPSQGELDIGSLKLAG